MSAIAGMLRVQNEARWIARVVGAISPICSKVLIFDDHSTDDTAAICRSIGCSIIPSPFTGLNEARDMQFLYTEAMRSSPKPDWIISIDGDEELEPGGAAKLKAAIESPALRGVSGLTFHILYLWDKVTQIRVDRVYQHYRRQRAFRFEPDAFFRKDGTEHSLHSGGAGHVSGLRGGIVALPLRLLHYGYLYRKDRLRKFAWHNGSTAFKSMGLSLNADDVIDSVPGTDPNNVAEDFYRHMIQGDVPELPPSASLRHAGPLTLRPLIL